MAEDHGTVCGLHVAVSKVVLRTQRLRLGGNGVEEAGRACGMALPRGPKSRAVLHGVVAGWRELLPVAQQPARDQRVRLRRQRPPRRAPAVCAHPPGAGLPDGAAVDVEGGYWCALHGGGRLRRFTAAGRFDRDVPLPVSQPAMCAFAGEELDEMYVTSAADKLSPGQRRQEPHAGALLRFRPGVRGVARRCTVS